MSTLVSSFRFAPDQNIDGISVLFISPSCQTALCMSWKLGRATWFPWMKEATTLSLSQSSMQTMFLGQSCSSSRVRRQLLSFLWLGSCDDKLHCFPIWIFFDICTYLLKSVEFLQLHFVSCLLYKLFWDINYWNTCQWDFIVCEMFLYFSFNLWYSVI